MSREIDFMSIGPISSQYEPLYAPDERLYESGEACWRVAGGKGPFDIQEFINDFCNWYDSVVDLRGSHLTSSIHSGLPRFFEGNLLMLGFLLWDVARYSCVYLGSGAITLEVRPEQMEENRYLINFSLKVPGLGIPREKEKMLFLPSGADWKRAGRKHASSNLYYAGIIAGLLGGAVHVRNNIGFGVEYITEICLRNAADW